MATTLITILAALATLAAAVGGCSALKEGEEPKTIEAPPTPVVPEAGKVYKTRVRNVTTYYGVLRGVNDSNKFDVVTANDELEIEFDWPDDASFYVKVIGRGGEESGDFDLGESGVIELTGGGKFTLVVYSRRGGGPWKAAYIE